MRIGLILLVLVCFLSSCKQQTREERLKEEGNALAMRVDSFQQATDRLPSRLEELGIEEKMEGPLYYQKVSDQDYMIYFGTTVGESMIYRSETGEWKDH